MAEHIVTEHNAFLLSKCSCGAEFSAEKNQRIQALIHRTQFTSRRVNCPFCKCSFDLNEWGNHAKNRHALSKPYFCDRCRKLTESGDVLFKRFGDLNTLKQHVLTVHGEEEDLHVCKICLRCYETVEHLREHLLWYNPSLSHTCGFCSAPMIFDSKLQLQEHWKSHHKRFCLSCPICDRIVLKSEYSKHMQKLHFIAGFECPVCFEELYTANSLKEHTSLHLKYKVRDLSFLEPNVETSLVRIESEDVGIVANDHQLQRLWISTQSGKRNIDEAKILESDEDTTMDEQANEPAEESESDLQ